MAYQHDLLLVIAVMAIGKLGDALAPGLIDARRPALLLALNANDLHLLLSVQGCATIVWWLLGLSRRVAEDGFYFWLGRKHGMSAARALLGSLGMDIAQAQRRWLQRTSLLALMIAPNMGVCLVAGCSTDSRTARWFLAADTVMTALRMALLRGVADYFEIWLGLIMEGCRLHYWPVLAVSGAFALAGVVPLVRAARRGRLHAQAETQNTLDQRK